VLNILKFQNIFTFFVCYSKLRNILYLSNYFLYYGAITQVLLMIKKLLVFTKAQVSAFAGGLIDYLVMIFLTEVFHIPYYFTIAAGGIIGACVNFGLNKSWTFYSKDIPYKNSFFSQLGKFIPVLLNSILLKSTGTYFITTFFVIDYKISRIITDMFVSIVFNYTLQKHWVFKKSG